MIIQAKDGKFYEQPWFSEGNFAFTERDSDCDSLIDANIVRIPALLVPMVKRMTEASRYTNAMRWMKKHGFVGRVVYEHMHESKMIFENEFQMCFVMPIVLGGPIPVPTKFLSGPFDLALTRYAWQQPFANDLLDIVYSTELAELRNTPNHEYARYLYSWLGAKTLKEMQARLRVARKPDGMVVRGEIKSLPKWIGLA